MRTVEEIKASIATTKFMIPISTNDEYNLEAYRENTLKSLEEELRAVLTTGIPLDRLEQICAAEKDGKLYTSHDVAVILASAIGDDCACNINSNDEWLPQLCELQEACPNPVGVACWEQYLKHRAEAEKALGKEQA